MLSDSDRVSFITNILFITRLCSQPMYILATILSIYLVSISGQYLLSGIIIVELLFSMNFRPDGEFLFDVISKFSLNFFIWLCPPMTRVLYFIWICKDIRKIVLWYIRAGRSKGITNMFNILTSDNLFTRISNAI